MHKLSFALAGAMLVAGPAAHAGEPMNWLSIGSKAPEPVIYASSGLDTAEAQAKGRVGEAEIEAHCGNWSPDDVSSCVQSTSAEFLGREASATANCIEGKLVSDGEAYASDGVWRTGVHEGRIRFRTAAGALVDQSNAGGGGMLAQRFEALCPGRPTGPLHVTAKVTIGTLKPVQVVDLKSLDGMPYDHNGSLMIADPAKGLIVYAKPKKSIAGTVKPGTVLYRGKPWTTEDSGEIPFQGVAYVFKKGCDAAEYDVRGLFHHDFRLFQFTLEGSAPVRDKTSCAITGHSSASGNAKLVFNGAGD